MSKLDELKRINFEDDLLIKIKLTFDYFEVMCAVVDTFSVDKKDYVVFLPRDAVVSGASNLLIFRFLGWDRDSNTIKYEDIDNEEEFYRIYDTYDALLNN